LLIRSEQFELRVGFHQPVYRHRHHPHRNAPSEREAERSLGYLPKLPVERLDGEAQASGRVGVIGVIYLNRETPGGEPPLPQPFAEDFGEPAEQSVEDGEIVGVGRESMGDPEFRSDFRREHRAGIDAAGLKGELTAPPAEDLGETRFADRGHLADLLQLILVEPDPDVVGNIGKNRKRVRGEERCFVAGTDECWRQWAVGSRQWSHCPLPIAYCRSN
jgi:hypothetical protein